MADLSVPDLAPFEQREVFTKSWWLANVGDVPWPEDTVLAHVEGERLTAAAEIAVGSLLPGAELEVSVAMQAPRREGIFSSGWALMSDGALLPGGSVWAVIAVGPPAVPLADIRGPFELGGHVFQELTYAEQMRHAGMSWIKLHARYPQDTDLADVIAEAHAQGFKVLVGAAGPPEIVRERGYAATLAAWMARFAAMGADAIEVWNEPNLPREWQTGYISPAAYTGLLCRAYAAIKGANRSTLVISAAPAPTGYFQGCTSRGCDDEPWLHGLYDAGAAGCFDYLGAHHNAGATSPAARTGHPADDGRGHHSWYFLPQLELYDEIFHGKRQLFFTELGYVTSEGYGWIPDDFSWGQGTSLALQARWLAEAVELSRASGRVRALVVWNVDATCYGECSGMEDPQAGYAIVRPGNYCLACDVLHEAMTSR